MTLWTNTDATNADKPKYASDKTVVFGVDAAEAQLKPAVTHAGWVKRTVGTGGRSGRVQYETLVAMGSITGDAEDTVFADPTIIIAAITTPIDLTAPDALTISAIVTGTASKLSYQWKVSANGTTAWTNVSGAKTATLSVDPTVVGTLYYKLHVSVRATDTTDTVSAESNVVEVIVA